MHPFGLLVPHTHTHTHTHIHTYIHTGYDLLKVGIITTIIKVAGDMEVYVNGRGACVTMQSQQESPAYKPYIAPG